MGQFKIYLTIWPVENAMGPLLFETLKNRVDTSFKKTVNHPS